MGDARITLRDGRRLGYAVYGDPHGQPVFYFHGFPGSRLEAGLAGATAAKLGVRLVAADRPGFGLSQFKPGRTIPQWSDDIEQLADALGFARFAALGVSGGGPYLLACARGLAHRLTAAGIFCGLGPLDQHGATAGMIPLNRLSLALAKRLPFSAKVVARLVSFVVRSAPNRALEHFARGLPAPDREVLLDSECRDLFIRTYLEALRQGVRGPARELVLFARPWGFALEEVSRPIHFWHGELDTIVPPALARAQQRGLRECRIRFFASEAHFSVVMHHMGEMLSVLAS